MQEYIETLKKRTEDYDIEINQLRAKAGLPPKAPEKLASLALAAGAVAAASGGPAAGANATSPSASHHHHHGHHHRSANGGAVTIKHEDVDALQQEQAELKAKLEALERQAKSAQAKAAKSAAAPAGAAAATSPAAASGSPPAIGLGLVDPLAIVSPVGKVIIPHSPPGVRCRRAIAEGPPGVLVPSC